MRRMVAHLLQLGERRQNHAAPANSLGRFDLDGLRAAPAGTPQVDVTFAIDLNGMVQVSARDRTTGRTQTVSVSARTAVAQEPALGGPKARAAKSPPVDVVEPALQQAAASPQSAEPARAQGQSDESAVAADTQAWPSTGSQPGPANPASNAAKSNPTEGQEAEAPLPSPIQAVLKEAELLLGLGDKLGGHDRSSIEKTAEQLRTMLTAAAAPDEVERSRSALRQLVTHVKEVLLLRRGR